MLSILLYGLFTRPHIEEGGRGRTGLQIKSSVSLTAELNLKNTASTQSKWQAVEGELNHFAAIKSQTVILKFIYVSFTICINTQWDILQFKNQLIPFSYLQLTGMQTYFTLIQNVKKCSLLWHSIYNMWLSNAIWLLRWYLKVSVDLPE